MSATIQTLNSRKQIVLNNASLARPITLPSGWAWVRVGMRFMFKPVGAPASLTGTPRLGVGVCQGTTNILGDAVPDCFCGVMSTSATWTWASPLWTGIQFSSYSRQGGTEYYSGGGGAPGPADMSGNDADPFMMLFAQIQKGNPWQNVVIFVNQTGANYADSTTFWSLLNGNTPSFSGYYWGMAGSTVYGYPATETGPTSVNIWWNRVEADLYIDELGVAYF